MAMLLRPGYAVLKCLPPELVHHLHRLDLDARLGSVLITLTNGECILDIGDRITLRGEVDGVSVAEMAECVLRRR